MKKAASLLALLFVLFALTGEILADFYRYVDDKGIIHFTNDASTIPEKLRSGAKIIKEDPRLMKKKAQSFDREKIVEDTKRIVQAARVEAEKFWWRWIVDPETGATKAPAIITGYLLAAMGTLVFLRRHLSGRLYKVAMKAVLFGFAAIIILTYSAHRGQKAYQQFKKSPIHELVPGRMVKEY